MVRVCEFCHEDMDGYTAHLDREGIGSVHIAQSHPMYGGWKLCISSGKRIRMTVRINYCPICGRKLVTNDD